VEGTTSIVEFETDVLGKLSVVETDPGPHTTAYGLLADFLNAVREIKWWHDGRNQCHQDTQVVKTYLTRQRQGIFKSTQQSVEALKQVDLEVQSGEIFGLLGPNGAGKTTLIKILTTLLLPTRGEGWVNGYHIVGEANQVRHSVGCMLMGERGLYWKLTGRENLVYFGALYHLSPSERKQRATEIIDLLSCEISPTALSRLTRPGRK
jgi:ABC-type uncharacterized transport system ATPase subunit